MADARSPLGSAPHQVRALIDAYRSNLARYERIETLSRRECELLRRGEPMSRVNDLLREKKHLLSEISSEESSVAGLRTWWMGARHSLAPSACEELLSLFDRISSKVESTLALESECRLLLRSALSWKSRPAPSKSVGAAIAYARQAPAGESR